MIKKRKDQPKEDEAAMSFHVTVTIYLTKKKTNKHLCGNDKIKKK